MTRAHISSKAKPIERLKEWELGVCPYCGSSNVSEENVRFFIRGTNIPQVGKIYVCSACESRNRFTESEK